MCIGAKEMNKQIFVIKLKSVCNLSIALAVVLVGYIHPAHAQQSGLVEQWYGNRHRIRRVPLGDQESRDFNNPSLSRPEDFATSAINQNYNQIDMRQQRMDRQRNFGGDLISDGETDRVQMALSRDRYVNTPQLDQEGIRHFANGRHFDLNQVPVAQAVQTVPTTAQNPQNRPGGQRNRRRDFDQANGPMPYF